MTRVSKIENTSGSNVEVKLSSGGTVTMAPKSKMENVNIDNVNDIKGRVELSEDLTEVNMPGGCTRIDG